MFCQKVDDDKNIQSILEISFRQISRQFANVIQLFTDM